MLAEIITIGDEILIGQTVDSNSAWLGKQLNLRGIDVERISSIRDTKDAIFTALKEAESRADIILMTGGLGPTNDDITKASLAEYFDVDYKLSEAALTNIQEIFKRVNRPLTKINEDQALVPANCEVLLNSKGTAPGMLFNENGIMYVSMPGVPYEMKAIMRKGVLPKLDKLKVALNIVHQTITVVNVPESIISEQISSIENSLPEHIKIAFLPHLNIVRVRLSGKSATLTTAELEKELTEYFNQIKSIIGNCWYEGEAPIAEIVGRELLENKFTLGCIESCTGGFISHSLTVIPGSSAYFQGSLITYSNEYKTSLLGVDRELFTTVGSVSEEVARQMASKGQQKLGVDFCISATGIAGPSGATADKEVGLVYIGLALADKTVIVKKNNFKGSRSQIIERTATTALEMLRQELKRISQNAQKLEQQL